MKTLEDKKNLKEQLEIRQVPVLSTAHCPTQAIAQGNLFAEHQSESWRLYHQNEYGCGYYFGDDKQMIDKELRKIVGNDMANLFLTLANEGFVEVRFDCDAEQIESLPAFEW